MRSSVNPLPALVMLGSILVSGVSGCAAARAGYFIVNAERKYQSAMEQGADERAPYEATLALAYLEKAKEEDGYSDYGVTEKLCKRSMEMSAKALTRSEDLTPTQNPETFVPEERSKELDKPAEPAPDLDIDLDDP